MKHICSSVFAPLIGVVLFLSGAHSVAEETDPAIAAVESNPKMVAFLKQYESDEYAHEMQSMTLRNGSCGFAGCSWSRLVSITVTRLVSNSPSTTIHARVSGSSPSVGPAKVEFVEVDLKPLAESRWNWDAGN